MLTHKIGIIYLNKLVTVLEVSGPDVSKIEDAAFDWADKSGRCKLPEHVELYFFNNPRHAILFSNVEGLQCVS